MINKYCLMVVLSWLLIAPQAESQLVPTINSQNQNVYTTDNLLSISQGSEQFALELFQKVSRAFQYLPQKQDFMISPFSVWSLLILLIEGSKDNTLLELQKALRVNFEPIYLREGYKRIQRALNVNTSTIEVSTLQAIFSDINRPVERDYEQIITDLYLANLVPVDFSKMPGAKDKINNYVKTATKGLIDFLVDGEDLHDAQMVMISAIFFKGQWKVPFNKSLTREEPFFDEAGQSLGNVSMMYQLGNFVYTSINDLESHVLEIPYGKENRLSMVIILPRKGVPLTSVTEKLATIRMSHIFNELKKASANLEEEEVEIFIPKFTTESHLTLNAILEQMGVLDLFTKNAELSKISQHPIFLSRLIHKTKIEVNEEGTIASAGTAGTFFNKASPPRFYINRPFAYVIVEKTTNSLLFCGQIQNPTHKQ